VKLFVWKYAVFASLKSWLRGAYHGVSRNHLARHLDVFACRFDERRRNEHLLGQVYGRAVPVPPSCG